MTDVSGIQATLTGFIGGVVFSVGALSTHLGSTVLDKLGVNQFLQYVILVTFAFLIVKIGNDWTKIRLNQAALSQARTRR